VPDQSVIRHTDVRSYIDDQLEVRGSSAGAVAEEVQRRLEHVKLPLEYHAELVGNYAAQDAARTRVLLSALAVALSIFLLLQAAFGSWRLATFAMVLLPSAVAGSLVGIAASGGMLTLGAMAGLLAVFGIAARNLVVLVRRCQQLERDEHRSFSSRLIMRVAHEQAGAVLATTTAMGVAMLPFIVGGDSPAFGVARPLALAAVSGLATSTLLTLFVAPAAVLVFATPRVRVAAHRKGISMKQVYQWLISVLCIATVLVSGCGPVARAQETAAARVEAVRVEPIPGSDVSRITLTQEAAQRLDIQVAEVGTTDIGGEQRSVVPYAALIYDLEGGVWAYTSPEPLTFVRERLDVDTIQGNMAVVSAGPSVGTRVVTVGAAELYGAEFEFQEG
jgi:preprotein translocase subunit SecF